MTFTTAALIIVAVAAIGLALVVYQLLARLEMLEASVTGGLVPPSRRLGREEFELRFATALLRSRLAADIGSGIVIGLDPDGDSGLSRLLGELARPDGVTIAAVDEQSVATLANDLGQRFATIALDRYELHPPTLPFLWIVDQAKVVAARPIASANDLIEVLAEHT